VWDNENGVGIDTVKVIVKPSTITHNGVTYGTVTSPYTGKVWLDRNLGASQVCTAYNDPLCYGDYYQWGRNTDGHEILSSGTTSILSPTIIPSHSDFITVDSMVYDWVVSGRDDNSTVRIANWSNTEGFSVCPRGYRVATIDEFKGELFDAESAKIQNEDDAFNSFLKLPAAGTRTSDHGTYVNDWLNDGRLTAVGVFWTASPDDAVSFDSFSATAHVAIPNNELSWGYSVRCIKD